MTSMLLGGAVTFVVGMIGVCNVLGVADIVASFSRALPAPLQPPLSTDPLGLRVLSGIAATAGALVVVVATWQMLR